MQVNYSETNNTTPYPLNGGVKPVPGTSVLPSNHPEIEKLRQTVEELTKRVQQLEVEKAELEVSCLRHSDRANEYYELLKLCISKH